MEPFICVKVKHTLKAFAGPGILCPLRFVEKCTLKCERNFCVYCQKQTYLDYFLDFGNLKIFTPSTFWSNNSFQC